MAETNPITPAHRKLAEGIIEDMEKRIVEQQKVIDRLKRMFVVDSYRQTNTYSKKLTLTYTGTQS